MGEEKYKELTSLEYKESIKEMVNKMDNKTLRFYYLFMIGTLKKETEKSVSLNHS